MPTERARTPYAGLASGRSHGLTVPCGSVCAVIHPLLAEMLWKPRWAVHRSALIDPTVAGGSGISMSHVSPNEPGSVMLVSGQILPDLTDMGRNPAPLRIVIIFIYFDS